MFDVQTKMIRETIQTDLPTQVDKGQTIQLRYCLDRFGTGSFLMADTNTVPVDERAFVVIRQKTVFRVVIIRLGYTHSFYNNACSKTILDTYAV